MDPKWNEPAAGFGRHRIFRVGWALHGCLREMESHARGERRCGGYQVAQDQIFSSVTVIASLPLLQLSRFVRSSVKSIQEPFRLLLDVHRIVTLNDLVFVPPF